MSELFVTKMSINDQHNDIQAESVIQTLPVPLALVEYNFNIILSNTMFDSVFSSGRKITSLSETNIDHLIIRRLMQGVSVSENIEEGDAIYALKILPHSSQGLYLLCAQNVTNENRLEKEVHYSKELLQTIVNNLPQYIFWKDSNSKFLGCNQSFALSAKKNSPADIVGSTDREMPWRNSAEKYIRDDVKVIKNGNPILGFEEWHTAKDGEKRIVKVDKIPYKLNDSDTGLIGIYIDNTENYRLKKNFEKANSERNFSQKVLSDFILNMQHDIRTPLAGIIGLSEIILSLKSNDMSDIHSATSDIAKSAQKLLSYCESMVEFHKHNQDNDSFPEITDIEHLLTDVIDIERPAVLAKSLEISYEIKPKNTQIIVDKSKLHRVLVNLVSNAVKFTEDGSINVTAEVILDKVKMRDALLRISVKDSGIGIKKDNLAYIFQEFSKVTPSYKGESTLNSGLGLRLVKCLVDTMGGDIRVDSTPGLGSCFTIDIPTKLPLGSLYGCE
tara:strand:+ start:6325 stop:7827 length:1503 start_codon:yes stop_codon:yes gene_type:complete